MAYFEGADWIAVVTLAGGTAAGLIGAWLTHRRPPAEDDARPEPAEMAVHLREEDRTLVHKLIDVVSRGVTRIEDALADHRRALDDNSDHLKRSRHPPPD